MPERVTRAQAEAAVANIAAHLQVFLLDAKTRGLAPKDASLDASPDLSTLRAYLAQRPDEETVDDEDERATLWRLAGADVDKMIDAIREVCAEAKAKVAEMPKPEEEA